MSTNTAKKRIYAPPPKHSGKRGAEKTAKSADPFSAAMARNDIAAARRSLVTHPPKHDWEKFNREAVLSLAEKKLKESEAWLRKAVAYADCGFDPYRNLTTLLCEQGLLRDALPFAKTAHEMQPDHAPTGMNYVNCLLDQARSKELIAVCDHFLQKDPKDKQFRLAKASSFRFQGRFNEAFLLLDEVLADFPEDLVAMRLQADVVAERDSAAGVVLYNNALKKYIEVKGKPDIALQWNMCLHLLRTRDFERGWNYWELGFHRDVGTMGRTVPKQLDKAPRADRLDKIDTDKWTMVCVEQGIGDQVLFLTGMADAIDEFKKIILVCESRMEPILKRSFPQVQTIQPGMLEGWTSCHLPNNGFIPLGSLLPRYRPTVESFEKARKPILQANGDIYHQVVKQLRERAQGRPIVGISWKGGFWENQLRNKALEISNWLPIFEQGALCVNLQYGDTSAEQKYIQELGYEMVSFNDLDFKKDIDAWTAIAVACDGIISVSTALVHFAGACGQKVGVIMPEPQGPWILGMDDEWSLAYPEVAIFRKERNESIRSLVDRVARVIV